MKPFHLSHTSEGITPQLPSQSLAMPLAILFNLLATIHIVWFYINRVPSYLHLERFEYGHERMPFQSRVLLVLPLRWAHNSPALQALAADMTAMPAWFVKGVHAEGLLEAVIDVTCVACAGIVATLLYRAVSRTGAFTAYIYPLVLVMVAGSYCLLNIHDFRYIYDLPSLGFFSIGLYLIYFRKNTLLLCAVFVIATLNRETSLLLLAFFAVSEMARVEGTPRARVRTLLKPRTLTPFLLLALFWCAWHIAIGRFFSANPTESQPRLLANIYLLLWPVVWPQIAGTAAFLLPFLLISWDRLPDPVFRSWRWMLPLWIMFMMVYGIILEIRLFGELIPVFACCAALVAEERLKQRGLLRMPLHVDPPQFPHSWIQTSQQEQTCESLDRHLVETI